MFVDFHTFLRYNLRRSDYSSMAHSVENRVPMLDHKLIEYAYSIDESLILKNGELKNILKKVATKYLPEKLVYREKKGFSAPITRMIPVANDKKYMEYIYKKWEDYYNNGIENECHS
jgi:asparagine synthase (glutamine-hydrolysing)